MILECVTETDDLCLNLQQMKDALGITGTEQDVRIQNMIHAARKEYEKCTRGILLTSTWDAYFDEFQDIFELPGPISSITSLKYYDTDNSQQTLASAYYDTDLKSHPARLTLAYGYTWPSTYDRMNAVVIRFVAGYTNIESIPPDIKIGLQACVAAFYDEDNQMLETAWSQWFSGRWMPV